MAKICMVAYTFYTSDARVRREAEALAERGDEVDFICLREGEKPMPREYHGVRLYPVSAGRYQGSSTAVYLLKYASFFIRAFILSTALHLRKRYDVMQVHTMPDFLVFAVAVPKRLGAKVILDVHDLMPELYRSKFNLPPEHWMIRLLTWVERRSIAFADRAIAVHAPHRNALIAHGNRPEQMAILLNVPDPRVFERNGDCEPRTDETFRLIYHGMVARRHGLEIALKAVARVRDQIPGLEFVVVGTGDDLNRVKNLAAEMALGDCVKFLGRMPVEDLPEQVRRADAGIVPILYDEFTRYMLPLKLLEYVGMGIPAIVSRTETIEAYFDDSMVDYFEPGNDPQLAERIVAMHRDSARRRALVSNASRFNDRYNWGEQRKSYYELVDALIGAAHVARSNQQTFVQPV